MTFLPLPQAAFLGQGVCVIWDCNGSGEVRKSCSMGGCPTEMLLWIQDMSVILSGIKHIWEIGSSGDRLLAGEGLTIPFLKQRATT